MFHVKRPALFEHSHLPKSAPEPQHIGKLCLFARLDLLSSAFLWSSFFCLSLLCLLPPLLFHLSILSEVWLLEFLPLFACVVSIHVQPHHSSIRIRQNCSANACWQGWLPSAFFLQEIEGVHFDNFRFRKQIAATTTVLIWKVPVSTLKVSQSDTQGLVNIVNL